MEEFYVYITAALIVGLGLVSLVRKTFDPFAPIWLFLLGYLQLYVVQPISFREYGLRARGPELVAHADLRALWALVLFLVVYHCGIARPLAACLPKPPRAWSSTTVVLIVPFMFTWGLYCSLKTSTFTDGELSAEGTLFKQFPVLMLLSGLLLIVTSRSGPRQNTLMLCAGLTITMMYMVLWMFNGKRSHSLFGVLTSLCAFYVTRGKRPSLPVLFAAGCIGALVVAMALVWRGNDKYQPSVSGFLQFASEFDLSNVLVAMNVKHTDTGVSLDPKTLSKESEEYGGYLLMLDTVPGKSEYDYGACYLRIVTTYIPRVLWPSKPVYGREEWIRAWIAGSEFERDEKFTGPSIGILGAAQLNGGAVATAIIMTVLALLLRVSYDFFRRYESYPFVQFWWSATLYNAWLMTVNDDPFVWFYYIYGFSTLPPLVFLWCYHKFMVRSDRSFEPMPHLAAPHSVYAKV
jgi:hypothetical protein